MEIKIKYIGYNIVQGSMFGIKVMDVKKSNMLKLSTY